MDWNILLNSERPRLTTSSGDHRTDFERDFDRSIFSTPVKRLQDKAQVFPLEPHDAVRTRLTHSLEVSSVARGLGITIAKWLIDQGKITHDMGRGIEAIAATCGLIHDLGNPPFGHAGEDAIRHWFATRFSGSALITLLNNREQLAKDFLLFEGNAQSLRLVTKLQVLADFHGLNLTYGTLSALCKYLAPSDKVGKSNDHTCSKPGFFASEEPIVRKIREKTGTGDARNPITFLVEAADDIVYSVADIEDSIKKKVLTWDYVQDKIRKEGDVSCSKAVEKMEEILKAGGTEISPETTDDSRASAFRTACIRILVESVAETFKENYDQIMSGTYQSELVEVCKAARIVSFLKKTAREDIFSIPEVLRLEILGRNVICDLMDLFWEGAQVIPIEGEPSTKLFSGKLGALFSNNYKRVFRHAVHERHALLLDNLPQAYHRLQLLTDYTCGMTDTFATKLHAELKNGV